MNQLARRDGKGIARLIKAGEGVREAQQAALAGGAPEELRTATDRQRDAVQALLRAAHDVLSDAGRPAGASLLDRVSSTLLAASVDEEARGLLESGRLTAEVDPARFELFPGITPSARPPEGPKPKDDSGAVRRDIRERTAALRELRESVRRLERDAAQARKAAERAAAEAEERERDAHDGKAELAAAEEAIADLKARLER